MLWGWEVQANPRQPFDFHTLVLRTVCVACMNGAAERLKYKVAIFTLANILTAARQNYLK
jgi:hypothetical protein